MAISGLAKAFGMGGAALSGGLEGFRSAQSRLEERIERQRKARQSQQSLDMQQKYQGARQTEVTPELRETLPPTSREVYQPGQTAFIPDITALQRQHSQEAKWQEGARQAERKYKATADQDLSKAYDRDIKIADRWGDTHFGKDTQWKNDPVKARVVASMKVEDPQVRAFVHQASKFAYADDLDKWVVNVVMPSLIKAHGSAEEIPEEDIVAIDNMVNYMSNELPNRPLQQQLGGYQPESIEQAFGALTR